MRLIIAGDYCPIGRVSNLFKEEHFSDVLSDFRDVLNCSDYSIVNLECPVVEHDAQPIDKCGPNLKCSKKGLEALDWTGFNCVTVANNHFLDYGKIGIQETINACDDLGIDIVGGGLNLDAASKILFKEINDQKVAIINCCEHEFSIATEKSAGSNPLNPIQQYYAIKKAKNIADYVIVIVHGGVEFFWLPSKRMIETYRFFIDAGADAVINHHQHCYSGYEVYNNKPIFYGLGNFCFDGNSGDYQWTSGCAVELNLVKGQTINFDLIPYRQCCADAKVRLMKDDEKFEFFNIVNSYNEILSNEEKLEKEYQKWCDSTKEMYDSSLNPMYNRFTKLIFKGKLGGRIISKRKMLQLMNHLVNESHIERVRMSLDCKIKKMK